MTRILLFSAVLLFICSLVIPIISAPLVNAQIGPDGPGYQCRGEAADKYALNAVQEDIARIIEQGGNPSNHLYAAQEQIQQCLSDPANVMLGSPGTGISLGVYLGIAAAVAGGGGGAAWYFYSRRKKASQ